MPPAVYGVGWNDGTQRDEEAHHGGTMQSQPPHVQGVWAGPGGAQEKMTNQPADPRQCQGGSCAINPEFVLSAESLLQPWMGVAVSHPLTIRLQSPTANWSRDPLDLMGSVVPNRLWNMIPGLAAGAALTLLAGAPTAVAATDAANVNAQRMLDPAATAANWMSVGGTYSEQHYSALTQINKGNVAQLGLAWFADYDTNLTQAGTPLEIDGVLYVSTAWNHLYAFDARSGKTLWEYNAKVPGAWIRNVCCGIVNRGIAAWNGKIYMGTLDGRLVAINARTGKEVWSVMTIDPTQHYSITVAPRVAKGKVLIGESGGEYGVRGYLSAYDAETGALDWRFYTVPGNPKDGFENPAMKKAAKTWGGEWWKLGGGGTVWDAIVFDPVTNLVYFGVGNGTPWNDHYRDPTTNDDLYLASIVALNVDTGQYVWHYQETPADTWDYDAVSPLSVVDMKIKGKQRRVLLQPSKNGIFYVIEARTGKLLNATPFVDVNWTDGVDLKTGRPRPRPEARFPEGTPINLSPGVQGAHGWHSNAYSPQTGLLYVPTQIATFPMVFDPTYTPSATGYNLGIDFGAQITYYRDHPDAPNVFQGYLQAIDPATGKKVWGGPQNKGPTGGAVATAGGLVFQGAGSSSFARSTRRPALSSGPARRRRRCSPRRSAMSWMASSMSP